MPFTEISCDTCGARLNVEESAATYKCEYCGTQHERDYSGHGTPEAFRVLAARALGLNEYGRALQLAEQGLLLDPHHVGLIEVETQARAGLAGIADRAKAVNDARQDHLDARAEANNYKIQAEQILHQLQANLQVHGSNSRLLGAYPADIDLALQYTGRCLELFPEDAVYLNLKALLVWQGKGDHEEARALLRRAIRLSPRDINIQHNLKMLNSSLCFIATAAYGTPFASEIDVLRHWRDTSLRRSTVGRAFIAAYYRRSPPVARFIASRPMLRKCVRVLLAPLVGGLKRRYPLP